MASMNQAYAADKPPQLIGNYDATQFIVSEKNQELLVTIKRENIDGTSNDGDVPLTNVEDSTLDFGVKWMMIANALGHLGEDVFLVNDPNMDAEDFNHYKILGLSHRNNPSSCGYLCFCKTRAGNTQFFKWYSTEILPNFVDTCRKLLPEEDRKQSFYLIADGELLQMQPFDNDVIQKMDEFNIDLGKGPASCTNTIGKACDRSNLFKSVKKTLKSVTSLTKVDFVDPVLEQRIQKIISKDHAKLSVEKRERIIRGVIKIARSLGRVVNFQIVSHGFQRVGLYPVDAKVCISNMDHDSLHQFDNMTLNDFVSKVPDLATSFLEQGQITEKQFDDVGIPKSVSDDRRSLPKDERCLSYQRAVMITNQFSRKRRQNWLAKRHINQVNTLQRETAGAPTSLKKKRVRAPNRSKEEIEEEKREKLERC